MCFRKNSAGCDWIFGDSNVDNEEDFRGGVLGRFGVISFLGDYK